MWVNSSSTVQAMTTDAEPLGRSRTSRAKATSIAAIPPLMSQDPRPWSRPDTIAGTNGGIVMPSVGTVS